jgi:predicted RNA polymerase sigma factor
LRLGRILAELAPEEPEVHGLVALMEIQASRSRARLGPAGEPISCSSIKTAHSGTVCSSAAGWFALERAERLGGAHGVYALQAAIAACHARARTADETDWKGIAALYVSLAALTPSPVVELNRAVAFGWRTARSPGSTSWTRSSGSRHCATITCCRACAATSSKKLGRLGEARQEFERAASLTRNARERTLLLERATACAG